MVELSGQGRAFHLRCGIDAYGVVTNKSFYGAYRGYGKDKGIRFMERIMDRVARELGMEPEEIRYRNFIQLSPREERRLDDMRARIRSDFRADIRENRSRAYGYYGGDRYNEGGKGYCDKMRKYNFWLDRL